MEKLGGQGLVAACNEVQTGSIEGRQIRHV
jgi:hypothetical protein